MFIRKSTHDKIIEDLHYSYGRKEYYLEQQVKRLRNENENLKIRLNKILDVQNKPRPSRSESLTRKIQSYETPSKTVSYNQSDLTATLLPSTVRNEYTDCTNSSSDYSSSSSDYSSSCDF